MAYRWRIHDDIVINPDIRFGKPVIAGTRITTQNIANQFYAYGKDAKRVARMYDVSVENIMNAVDFEKSNGTVKLFAA